MNDHALTAGGSVPPDLAPHVEPICRAFEAACEAGERPSLEDYIRDTPPAAHTVLLRELLRLDLAHRARRNEPATLEEYRLRFPEEGNLIRAVLGDTPTGPPLPEPAGEPAAGWPAVPGYEILGELAPGGMGVVYRARQIGLKRTVALKMIRTGVHAGPQERARFRVEAEAVASLSHPHIIQIHEFGEWEGVPYLAMELAEGGSLAGRLAGGPLPAAEAAALVETLARAVQFVHDRGLIHRDLKPANVLLTGDGVAKLADFGLAKRLDQDQGLTRTRAVLGTASYMAPEQAAGDTQALGPAADVYALGAILYEVLTGRPPFRAATHELTIHQVLSEEPPPPTQLRPDVPAELEAICLKCLEKEPGQRFASAAALAEDLRRYQDGEPISIRTLGVFDWHSRAARRVGYEILETLGAGNLGTVYKARQLRLGRTVVLEMSTGRPWLDPGWQGRLRPQAYVKAQLHHPNIVEVYDWGEHNGELYVAREHVEGGSLADEAEGPPKPVEQTAALVETLARAVHHAHQRGLVHGSLRLSKVLLAADGTPKITGFGLARMLRDEPAPSPQTPRSGCGGEGGTNDPLPTEPATDVHALGAMLHELLTGRSPGPKVESATLPRGLGAICLKCLEPEPAGRYPSAAALAEDLRRFRTGEVLFIDDLDDWAQQMHWARRAGYEILELLASGRKGFTYKARLVALDRVVVLKRITARDRFVPGAKSRFRWQAHLLARLRHPNIAQLHDQGEQNDLCYFAREFVDGRSLADRAAESPLPARAAAELAETLVRAVQAAHAAGVVHGGLNPGVVYLTPAAVPKITSFRRARLPGSEADEGRPESELRRRAAYLAPEQLAGGNRRLAPSTDVYGLGAILYTLLTGQPPFAEPTVEQTLEQVRSQEPAPPGRRQPGVPAGLEALCLKCLEKEPGRRPASAKALADGLRPFLGR
jgi:serine/threonine protein kinase